MRSAWVCTRNDVLGNLAVLLAAVGVFGTGTGWPDVIVATIMAGLALQGAWIVLRQSRHELRIAASPPDVWRAAWPDGPRPERLVIEDAGDPREDY